MRGAKSYLPSPPLPPPKQKKKPTKSLDDHATKKLLK